MWNFPNLPNTDHSVKQRLQRVQRGLPEVTPASWGWVGLRVWPGVSRWKKWGVCTLPAWSPPGWLFGSLSRALAILVRCDRSLQVLPWVGGSSNWYEGCFLDSNPLGFLAAPLTQTCAPSPKMLRSEYSHPLPATWPLAEGAGLEGSLGERASSSFCSKRVSLGFEKVSVVICGQPRCPLLSRLLRPSALWPEGWAAWALLTWKAAYAGLVG